MRAMMRRFVSPPPALLLSSARSGRPPNPPSLHHPSLWRRSAVGVESFGIGQQEGQGGENNLDHVECTGEGCRIKCVHPPCNVTPRCCKSKPVGWDVQVFVDLNEAYFAANRKWSHAAARVVVSIGLVA